MMDTLESTTGQSSDSDLGTYGLFSLTQEDDSTMQFTLQSMLTKQKAQNLCWTILFQLLPFLSVFYLPHSYAFLKEVAYFNSYTAWSPWLWLCFPGAFVAAVVLGRTLRSWFWKVLLAEALDNEQTVTEGMWNINYSYQHSIVVGG